MQTKLYFRKLKILNFLILTTLIFIKENCFCQDYFPLHIGNYWIYKRRDFREGYDRVEIIDTMKVNKNTYFIFREEYDGGYDYWYEYYRKDEDNQVLSLSLRDSVEVIMYKLGVPVHSYWYINKDTESEIKVTLENTNSIQYTIAGVFDSCYYYSYNFTNINTRFDFWLAPGIGLIRRETEGESAILKGACINGIIYGDTATAVDNSLDTHYKADFIFHNFPNPFNRSTTISYRLTDEKPIRKVKLKLYDVSGQVIKTLVDTNQSPGIYYVLWDGRNDFQEDASSGIIICELQVDNTIHILKMVLIK